MKRTLLKIATAIGLAEVLKHAVAELARMANFDSFHFVIEADIKWFFDNIDHEWLLKMIEQLVDDRAFIGLTIK